MFPGILFSVARRVAGNSWIEMSLNSRQKRAIMAIICGVSIGMATGCH